MAVIPDFGANHGLVVGPKITEWCSLPKETLSAKVSIDGISVGEATTSAIGDDPMQAMRFLLELCRERDITLHTGSLISTGAVTGVHDVNVSSTARIDFGSFGSFEVGFEALSPVV